MHTHHTPKINLCDCSEQPQVLVVEGLAQTAADVAILARKGVPITTQNQESNYFEGYLPSEMQNDPEFTRGYGINDAWKATMEARTHINAARKAQRLKQAEDDYIQGKDDHNPYIR